ncbi:MAG: thiamine pyrophosphate-requiring protein [Acidobacteriota bacterium]|nr:thiamine pyrophosphate-requiring protein [Acidobacteriota bacterium]
MSCDNETRRQDIITAADCYEGHELILQSLAANDVKKIFFCGGTDNFYFMESVAKFKALGKPCPDLITVLHESDAVYMNMGYFQWTGKPQVTLLHVDCGTINAGGAWPEAWHANAGIVVIAGRTPWTTKNELPGARSISVHWQQEVYDQAAIVRQYTKWDYGIKTIENASLIIQSAFRIAASEPCGPVYLTLPREVAAAKIPDGLAICDPDAFKPAVSPQGDSAALREAAKKLAEAQNPIIIVKSMGRHPEAVAVLVKLAEKLAIPVLSTDVFMNFPKRHWARVDKADLQNRDIVLIIDHDVPWIHADPPKTATIISMDSDPMRLKQPLWGYPVHIPIACDSSKALPVLLDMTDEFITAGRKSVFEERRKALYEARKDADETLRGEIEKARTARTISPVWIKECVNRISDENTVLLWDISPIGQGDRTPPGHVFAQYAANLGNSWPRGIGIKMAAPDKMVIASGGDGSTIFANPEAALWTSLKYGAPILYIVNNNNRYGAVQVNLDAYGGSESYAGKAGFNGSDLSPSPDFAMIAKAVGAYGENVMEPGALPGALQRCLDAVRGGRAAVLDIITAGK